MFATDGSEVRSRREAAFAAAASTWSSYELEVARVEERTARADRFCGSGGAGGSS